MSLFLQAQQDSCFLNVETRQYKFEDGSKTVFYNYTSTLVCNYDFDPVDNLNKMSKLSKSVTEKVIDVKRVNTETATDLELVNQIYLLCEYLQVKQQETKGEHIIPFFWSQFFRNPLNMENRVISCHSEDKVIHYTIHIGERISRMEILSKIVPINDRFNDNVGVKYLREDGSEIMRFYIDSDDEEERRRSFPNYIPLSFSE